jgi:hypothetical protein
LVATDPTVSAEFILQGYCRRWSVDKAHPDSTSSLGWSRIGVSDYNSRRRVA